MRRLTLRSDASASQPAADAATEAATEPASARPKIVAAAPVLTSATSEVSPVSTQPKRSA